MNTQTLDTRTLAATPSAYPYPLLIKRIFMSAARFEGGRHIHYRDDLKFSYAEFAERVCRLANVLKAQGVKPGDTVAVLDWDSHRYLECFFAVPMIGAVLHTVNIRMSVDQIVYTMNHAEDDLVLVHDDFLPLLEPLQDQLPTVKRYIAVTDQVQAADTSLPIAGEYESLLAAADSHYEFPDFDENSVATLFYTTGTTGNPKGVCFSHRQLVLHTMNLIHVLGCYEGLPLLNSGKVYMPMTPMFHVHAWGVPYAATMLGATQVYPGRYEPQRLLSLVRQYDVNFSHCVPTILQMLLAQLEEGENLDGWTVLIGGSPLTAGMAKQAQARGIELFTAYGMSETCPLLTVTHLSESIRSCSDEQQLPWRLMAGVPSPMVELEVITPEGKALPADGSSCGEVVVRAPWLTQLYLHEPEKSEELWQGGWLHTGDIACRHPNGFVEIRDRLKDVIKTGGEWISSLTLESLISSHAKVASVAVVGVADDRWGERPMALIIPSDDSLSDEDIREHLQHAVDSGQINKWGIPSQIHFVTEIPRTSVGKIDKKRIRGEFC